MPKKNKTSISNDRLFKTKTIDLGNTKVDTKNKKVKKSKIKNDVKMLGSEKVLSKKANEIEKKKDEKVKEHSKLDHTKKTNKPAKDLNNNPLQTPKNQATKKNSIPKVKKFIPTNEPTQVTPIKETKISNLSTKAEKEKKVSNISSSKRRLQILCIIFSLIIILFGLLSIFGKTKIHDPGQTDRITVDELLLLLPKIKEQGWIVPTTVEAFTKFIFLGGIISMSVGTLTIIIFIVLMFLDIIGKKEMSHKTIAIFILLLFTLLVITAMGLCFQELALNSESWASKHQFILSS